MTDPFLLVLVVFINILCYITNLDLIETTCLVGHYSKVAKSVNGCRQLTTSLVGHYSIVARSVNDLLYIYM
jgi:hypothetical protein